MAKLLMNGSITEGDWEVLKRGKLASSVAQHDVEIVEMDADKVPPPQSTVLSLGKYEPQNGENVVELPTIGKLYAQCNALSMIALAFERAVLGDNLPKFTYEMCTHVESIPRGKWYVDIETKGDVSAQKPSWDKIISMSITVAETGHTYVLPEEYIQIARIDIQNTLRGIPDSIVMHNGQFDAKYIGVPFDDDTMLKHYAVFPVASHGLKELGKYYLGMDDWDASAKKYLGKLTTKEKNMVAGSPDDVFYTEHGAYYESGVEYTAQNGYERIPRPTLYKYNALDTYVTWLLDELIDERWFLQDGYDYARTTYEMLLEYSHMFLDIEQHGIRFDVPYMEELELELESKQVRLEEDLNEIVGYPVNPRSPKQVKEALKERGFRVKSTNESTLETLDDPMAEKILEIRHVSKQLGTYVRGYKNQLIGDYGYPSFKLHASTTGRIGGSGPSLLTLPRDKTMKKMVLPDEGQTIVGADLSQAELRVMACESGDNQLIEAFAPDAGDFFDILLAQAYDDFDRDADDYGELRTSMKSVVYGKSFARGDKAIAQELSISVEEAEQLSSAFIVPGSDFHKWRTKMANKAVRAEPIDTKFGRRYHNETVRFYNSENIKRTGLSFTSQATANDICLQAAYRIWDSGILKRKYNARIMSTLHDAIYVSCPPEHAEEVGKLIVDTLQMVGQELYGDTVPFTSDWDYGSHLGELD